MEIHFYLRKPDKERSASGKSLILLQVKHKRTRYWWSTGESILADNWNKKTQRVKENKAITQDNGERAMNKTLDKYEKRFREAFYRSDEIPTPEEMRLRMDELEKGNAPDPIVEPNGPTFHSMIQDIVDRVKRKGVQSTIDNNIATQKHLLKLAPPPFNFENITEEWWDDYVEALREGKQSEDGRGCGGRTINNDLLIIRRVMDKANDLGLTKNKEYEGFEVDTEDADGVALTPDEIDTIYQLQLSGRLAESRDLLIVACHTGLRWSDFSNISPDRIVKNNGGYDFVIRTKKTGAPVTIPAHPAILKIFERYPDSPNMLPRGHRKRQFNDDVKDLSKGANGFDLAGLSWKDPKKQLWEMVSSRIGRRSFCTNLYADREKNGMTLSQIMEKSGHKTESAFFKYIKPRSTESSDALRRIHESVKDRY